MGAQVIRADASNDLAVLKATGTFTPLPLGKTSSVWLGSSVFTIGFPNTELRDSNPNSPGAKINGMSRIRDDPREFQINVQVQPGNSGGPLLNELGNVIGVVVSKLDAAKTLPLTGDLPQNVNYAIKVSYALPLLETVPNLAEQLVPAYTAVRSREEIARQASKALVLVLVER